MSVIGERDGLAMELRTAEVLDGQNWIEEYWEGDPPSFYIDRIEKDPDRDNTFVAVTSAGNRLRVTVEVED